jgi:hypothetical protein
MNKFYIGLISLLLILACALGYTGLKLHRSLQEEEELRYALAYHALFTIGNLRMIGEGTMDESKRNLLRVTLILNITRLLPMVQNPQYVGYFHEAKEEMRLAVVTDKAINELKIVGKDKEKVEKFNGYLSRMLEFLGE